MPCSLDTTGELTLVQTKQKTQVYQGATAPLTSLTISPSGSVLIAGCWDKSIWSWNISTGRQLHRYQGHSDFVKTVICGRLNFLDDAGLETTQESGYRGSDHAAMLVSGSADTSIIIWRLTTGQKLHSIKNAHSRGILTLSIDPSSYDFSSAPGGGSSEQPTSFTLFSGGSEGSIKRWLISSTSAKLLPFSEVPVKGNTNASNDEPESIGIHDTSVNKIYFPHLEVSDDPPDMYTASSDNKALVSTRTSNFRDAETTLEHPDFVRDVLVDEESGLIATACRDENVRVWDNGTGKCIGVLEGHYEEVTGLAIIEVQDPSTGKMVKSLVSVSIDGTIRRWPLHREGIAQVIKEIEHDKERVAIGMDVPKSDNKENGPQLTEDEERELAELMEDDE